jgi:hypothetical protein
MGKMGRPLKHLVYDDNQVAGLSLDKGTKTYYASYKDDEGKFKKATFGRDKLEAISKFRSWQEHGGLAPEKKRYIEKIGASGFIVLSKRIIV